MARADGSLPEHALEDRIDLFQVIAKIEQRLELLRAQGLRHVLVGFEQGEKLAFAAPAGIALRWTIA